MLIDVTQLAISLIKNRLQDTYGSRLKFISGSSRRESAHSSSPEDQSGLTSAATSKERGVHAASVPKRETAQKRAEARAPEGRAGSPLPAAAALGREPENSGGLPTAATRGAHGVTRPTDVHIVRIIGEPTTPNEAGTLAEEDKFQFQWWALGLVGARPVEQKKGADHGIDGKILFRDDPRAAKPEQIIIQVKGGKTGVKDVRDLRGVLDREKAAIGVLISLQTPTGPMETESASAGFYEHKTNQQKYPRLQLRTVKELMEGKGIERPTSAAAIEETFKKAPKAKARSHEQSALGL